MRGDAGGVKVLQKHVAAKKLKRRMTSHELISKDAFKRKQPQQIRNCAKDITRKHIYIYI